MPHWLRWTATVLFVVVAAAALAPRGCRTVEPDDGRPADATQARDEALPS